MEARKQVTTVSLKKMKQTSTPIAMVTAYDYPSAKLAEEAGADVILVGDSLGMVVLGYDSTLPVTVDDMLHHTKAVTRAVRDSFVVTDMPFMSYHGSLDFTLRNVARIVQEGRPKAVKMEGGREIADTVTACVQAGVPVMGHLGLTPQAVNTIGGYRVQGRQLEEARRLLEDAKALEQAGVFAFVLEMVPEELADRITREVQVPVIGIGAGRHCDGQVLVYHDLLQYASPLETKFVKHYAETGEYIKKGIGAYVREVKERAFPAAEHVFKLKPEVLKALNEER